MPRFSRSSGLDASVHDAPSRSGGLGHADSRARRRASALRLRRIHARLQREGRCVNRKLVHRLYEREGLAVRRRPRRKLRANRPMPLIHIGHANQHSAMTSCTTGSATAGNFARSRSSTLSHASVSRSRSTRRSRVLASRACWMRSSRSTECRGRHRRQWTGAHLALHARQVGVRACVTLHFIQPGKPMQNGALSNRAPAELGRIARAALAEGSRRALVAEPSSDGFATQVGPATSR